MAKKTLPKDFEQPLETASIEELIHFSKSSIEKFEILRMTSRKERQTYRNLYGTLAKAQLSTHLPEGGTDL